MRARARTLTVATLTCLFSYSARVAAEDDAVTAAARTLAVDGVKLAQTDQCAEAVDKLERAEKLHHSAIVLGHLGTCYVKLGRLVEGIERLRAVLREPLPDNPSEALTQAHERARQLLDASKPKLATLTVSVEGGAHAEVAVTIDGTELPTALLGAARPTDPGEHSVKASAPGYLTATRRITLAPGDAQDVTLDLVKDQSQSLASTTGARVHEGHAAPRSAIDARSAANSGDRPYVSRLPAYVSWGAAAVALGVGVGFGVAALHDRNALAKACPHNVCAANQRDALSTARLNATISTVGYGVAIAAAGAGTLLFFLLGPTEHASPEATHTPHVQARVGWLAADVTASF